MHHRIAGGEEEVGDAGWLPLVPMRTDPAIRNSPTKERASVISRLYANGIRFSGIAAPAISRESTIEGQLKFSGARLRETETFSKFLLASFDRYLTSRISRCVGRSSCNYHSRSDISVDSRD